MRRTVCVMVALLLTTPAFGATLTANKVTKAKSASVIVDSQITDNGTNVGVGTAVPLAKLEVAGTVKATAFTGAVTGAVTGNVTGNLTGGINWTDTTAFGTGSAVSADKFTGDINWTDKNLFQKAYSGINWTDAPYPCFSATGVMSSDADGTCP